jgi:hypothetical protein
MLRSTNEQLQALILLNDLFCTYKLNNSVFLLEMQIPLCSVLSKSSPSIFGDFQSFTK